MLAHLPNRFNSLTRGRVRATCTPAENHYNGAKLFVFARFAFARSRVCTSTVSRDASRESSSFVATNSTHTHTHTHTHTLSLSLSLSLSVCMFHSIYCVRSVRGNARPRGWLVGWLAGWLVGFCMKRWKASLLQPFLRTVLLSRRSSGS